MNTFIIMIICYSLAVILILWQFFVKRKQFLTIIAILLFIAGTVIPSLLMMREAKLRDENASLKGEIKANIQNTSDGIIVHLGATRVSFRREDFISGVSINVLSTLGIVDKRAEIKIKISNTGLVVSTQVRGLDGKVVAEIGNNNWLINPNNYFLRNYDNSAFEVIDQYETPVLQIELVDNSNIRIGGIFAHRPSVLIIHDKGTIQAPLGEDEVDTSKLILRHNVSMTPWFLKDKLGIRSEYGKHLQEEDKENTAAGASIVKKLYLRILSDNALKEKMTILAREILEFQKKQWNDPDPAIQKWIREYNEIFRDPAIAFHNEAVRRLNAKEKKYNPGLLPLYINPTNIFGLEMIAKDLDQMAKSI